jgi:hypothetical protein
MASEPPLKRCSEERRYEAERELSVGMVLADQDSLLRDVDTATRAVQEARDCFDRLQGPASLVGPVGVGAVDFDAEYDEFCSCEETLAHVNESGAWFLHMMARVNDDVWEFTYVQARCARWSCDWYVNGVRDVIRSARQVLRGVADKELSCLKLLRAADARGGAEPRVSVAAIAAAKAAVVDAAAKYNEARLRKRARGQ